MHSWSTVHHFWAKFQTSVKIGITELLENVKLAYKKWSVSGRFLPMVVRTQLFRTQVQSIRTQVWVGSYRSLSHFLPKTLIDSYIYSKSLTHEPIVNMDNVLY